MSTTLSVRVEPEVKARLDALADATQRSRSFLAAEAIREYVEINEWQLQEIQNGVAEADVGDFASDDELASLARKWRVDAGA
jgi:Predicted transcriptional regulator